MLMDKAISLKDNTESFDITWIVSVNPWVVSCNNGRWFVPRCDQTSQGKRESVTQVRK